MTYKSELVKYLHKEKGFDLLLFESNFFPLQKLIEEENKDFKNTKKYIFPIYTNCNQCSGLFSYIDSTYAIENPLLVSGFDMQAYFEKDEFSEELKDLMNKSQIVIQDTTWFYTSLHTMVKTKNDLPIDELSKLINYTDSLSKEGNSFVHQEMKSLKRFLQMRKVSEYKKKVKPYEYLNVRDSSMAENALWLIKERYPNKKIIVWAHNVHLSRYERSKFYYMGSGLYNALGDEMYSIGFTAYEGAGKYAVNNIEHVKKSTKNSLEDWMYKKKYKTSFTDLKELKKKDVSFTMDGLFHSQHLKLKWADVFDGIIYIQSIAPCKPIIEDYFDNMKKETSPQ